MFLFDLPGPQFLVFYATYGLAVCGFLWQGRRREDDSTAAVPQLDDPYMVAYLRGGESEALRVALLSLIDRNLIKFREGKKGFFRSQEPMIRTATRDAASQVSRPIEKGILEAFSSAEKASNCLKALSGRGLCAGYESRLTRLGLLPNHGEMISRLMRLAFAVVALGAVSLPKISIGLSRHRPVSFLVLETGFFAFLAYKIAVPPRTPLGDRVIQSMKVLFYQLEMRANSLRPGGGTNELSWLAAVFGIAAVPELAFPYKTDLFPKAAALGSASCGASCGSTGGCGGGCGGCGGCGG